MRAEHRTDGRIVLRCWVYACPRLDGQWTPRPVCDPSSSYPHPAAQATLLREPRYSNSMDCCCYARIGVHMLYPAGQVLPGARVAALPAGYLQQAGKILNWRARSEVKEATRWLGLWHEPLAMHQPGQAS